MELPLNTNFHTIPISNIIDDIKFGKYKYIPCESNIELGSMLIELILFARYKTAIVVKHNGGGVYEIVDGNKRISTLIDFCDNKFPIQSKISPIFEGVYFSQMANKYQNLISGFRIDCFVTDNDDLAKILKKYTNG